MDIFSDGGARGNPGPAACAFVAIEAGKVVRKEGKYLGKATNNVAEYNGVILALSWLVSLPSIPMSQYPSIRFYMDSELIVKQINGLYKVKDKKLKELFLGVQSFLKKISGRIIFKNIPRTKNKLADFLVNKTLDEI